MRRAAPSCSTCCRTRACETSRYDDTSLVPCTYVCSGCLQALRCSVTALLQCLLRFPADQESVFACLRALASKHRQLAR